MTGRHFELATLAGVLLLPFLPLPLALLLLPVLGALWLRRRPPRRELVAVSIVLAIGVTALLLLLVSALAARRSPGPLAAAAYERGWEVLRGDAAAAAAALREGPGNPLAVLDPPPDRPQPGPAEVQRATLAAFDRLARVAPPASEGGERRALLLIDPAGNSVAWAGEGLIHEPGADAWTPSGTSFHASFNAVTLFAAEPLDEPLRPGHGTSYRPWRVVAGASFPNEALPRPPLPGSGRGLLAAVGSWCERGADAVSAAFRSLAPPPARRWSLVDSLAQAHPGVLAIRLRRFPAPILVLEPGAPATLDRVEGRLRRLIWATIACALIVLAVTRGVGVALPAGSTLPTARDRPGWLLALALAGVFAGGMAGALPAYVMAGLLAGLGLAAWGLAARLRAQRAAGAIFVERGLDWRSLPSRLRQGLLRPPEGRGDPAGPPRPLGWWARRQPPTIALAGALAISALFAVGWVLQRLAGPLASAERLMATPSGWCLRLAWTGAALGLLAVAGRREAAAEAPPSRDRWGWLAALALFAAAASADTAWLALPLLAAGGACAALFADRQRLGQWSALAALLGLSCLAAAGAWETAYRLRLSEQAGAELLARLAPPAPAEVASLAREAQRHFAGLDLEALGPRAAANLDTMDLAYALWRGSPLARPYALSALEVTSLEAGREPVSSFSFGVPATREGRPDPGLLARLPGWDGTGIAGEVVLRAGSRPWGHVRYWLVPRPGFRAADPRRLARIEIGLLRGGPTASWAEEVAAPALYALYSAPGGRAVVSPWEERPGLPPALRAAPPGGLEVETPAGPALAHVRARPGAWEVTYLPRQAAANSLERAADWCVGVFLLLALAAPPALLLALPRAAFRDLLRVSLRSYSKRLLIVYTLLLLLPLLLLNVVLVRSVEKSLELQQRSTGEAALRSAQQLLGESIRELPAGFVFDRPTFDPRLISVSEVIQHEVNLYWRSGLSASSKHELFTSGLLPKRIPGPVYSSLALSGRNLYALTNRAAGVPYLELYSPLRVTGEELDREPQLFLSVPLLAQQEEAERQVARLIRHGVLATVSLFVLLAVVGSGLARNFTRPITELVEGTRRIAAGATSLDLAPTDLELAALVRAVDDMAGRIASGRERLVREKQVVERMVDNITSGVVSVDRERRVLMHNSSAAEMLGVAVGQNLERKVASVERLAPVAAFLRSAGGEMARATVRLADPAGEREWSLVWVPLPGAGEPSALLVVEDATEELRGQRLLAWAQMARMIAHEIKNPLTPIRLSAEHMREVWHSDPQHFGPVFERCTSNILGQVEELRSIASEFSIYSAIPRIDPQPGDLGETVAELVEGYRTAPPRGVSIGLETPAEPLVLRFDGKLLSRAVRNLLENALRASAEGGRVLVRVERNGAFARIAVLDSGPGVRPDLLQRIFEPYFSTHATGTGLGLPIARRIAEEHGGEISARNLPEGGLEAAIRLPL